MSKLSALITMLVLGAGSAAMASSTSAFEHRGSTRTASADRDPRLDRREPADRRWRDPHGAGDAGARRYRTSWVALGAPIQLADGRDSVRVSDRGTFTQLRLQTMTGASHIERVVIRFADGSRQVVEPGRVLDRRNGMFEILLDGNNRRIDRVVLEGESARRGELQVYGI